MGNVSDNRNLESVEFAFALPNRQRIEESLRRMLVSAIPGIDHSGFRHARYGVRCSRGTVPDNHTVCRHRIKGPGGVDQRFALGNAAARCCDIDDVGRKTLAGDLKGCPRSR
jgi:hypothetical protein